MADLLFWFLVAQTVQGLPNMMPGTEVWIMSPDLFTKYATAVVEDGTLAFGKPLEPGQEVRLVIYPPDAGAKARAEGVTNALYGRIDPQGSDILIRFEELDGPLSLRKWLAEERGLLLQIPATPSSRPGTTPETGGNE